jgi:glycosyltransferase involved in cell wall biosynthesis
MSPIGEQPLLRIAQVAPLYESVPPKLYGGTERIVAHLTNALVDLGHDVTLFATCDANTRATLVPVRDEPIRLDKSPLKSDLASHLSMLHEVHRRRADFDIIHFHTDMLHFPIFNLCAARTVTTLHGRLDLKDLAGVYSRWPEFPLVSISDDQRLPLASASWIKTIYHGVKPCAAKVSVRDAARSPTCCSWAASRQKNGRTARSLSPKPVA